MIKIIGTNNLQEVTNEQPVRQISYPSRAAENLTQWLNYAVTARERREPLQSDHDRIAS